MDFVSLLMLPPVARGLVSMVIAGAGFPLCGVMVLRLNLIPIRYMLMHGVILGGALSLAFSLPSLPVTIAVNVLLVFVLLAVTKDPSHGFGMGSAVAMVLSMAVASLVMHAANVPANDALSLLWGSPFALSFADVAALSFAVALLVAYIAANFRRLLALFFTGDVALSLGINPRIHYAAIILIIALFVALAMKLLGALLIDSLLILPVLLATRVTELTRRFSGIRSLFIISALSGLVLSVTGMLIAIAFDLPPSGAIALVSGFLYIASGAVLKLRQTILYSQGELF